MKIDTARMRKARGLTSPGDVAHVMRRCGLKGTDHTWVRMVESGRLEPDERCATALAAALGVGLSEILDPGEHEAILYALAGDLAAIRSMLNGLDSGALASVIAAGYGAWHDRPADAPSGKPRLYPAGP